MFSRQEGPYRGARSVCPVLERRGSPPQPGKGAVRPGAVKLPARKVHVVRKRDGDLG